MPEQPQTFKDKQERNDYLETVAISYMMNVVLGRVTYDDHKYKSAMVILGYLERTAHRAETPISQAIPGEEAESESPEVLYDKEMAKAQASNAGEG